MIEISSGRVMVKSPMTMLCCPGLLDAGKSALQPGVNVFDLSPVTEADSAAVAAMLGWLRAASALGASIQFEHVPAGVRSLAKLYGVHDLLPIV